MISNADIHLSACDWSSWKRLRPGRRESPKGLGSGPAVIQSLPSGVVWSSTSYCSYTHSTSLSLSLSSLSSQQQLLIFGVWRQDQQQSSTTYACHSVSRIKNPPNHKQNNNNSDSTMSSSINIPTRSHGESSKAAAAAATSSSVSSYSTSPHTPNQQQQQQGQSPPSLSSSPNTRYGHDRRRSLLSRWPRVE